MTRRSTLTLISSAALAAALATPALAEATAEQVWQAWQDTVAQAGGTLSANARRSGDGLVLIGLAWQPDRAEPARLKIERLTLLDRPDGSVAVLLPDRFSLTLQPDPSVRSASVDLLVAAPDLAVAIRGLGPVLDFDARAPSVSIALDEASLKRAEVEEDVFATLAAADLSLAWRQDLTAPDKSFDGSASLGTLHAEIRMDTPLNGKGTASLDLASLTGHLRGLLPASGAGLLQDSVPPPGMPVVLDALADGLFFDSEVSHGPLALLIDVIDPAKGPVLMDLTAASGTTLLSLDKTKLAYDSSIGAMQMKLRLNDPTVPFDQIDLGLSEYRTAASLGLGDLISPQPWTMAFRLTGLTVSDNAWALVDPKAALPRDPLALALGLSGTWAIDPAALKPGFVAPPDAPPPLTTLTAALDELLLRGLGAELTGQGALDFDLTDTTTFDGAPAPTGTLSFAARGLNALLDKAQALGALSDDELAGARFGLLMLGKAGAAPDTLTSQIEFRDKSIWLNGQKLK